ncbi:MAG: hypothetical protein ATN35_02520 [Epulopiscium sp. Nele67-Bin004]|nr:MAG: hypothetical protein ATN35_02520 [Epulopiscium sp. Nele67-Bin004]
MKRKSMIALALASTMLLSACSSSNGASDTTNSSSNSSSSTTNATNNSENTTSEPDSSHPSYLNMDSQFPIVNEPITLTVMVSQGAVQGDFEDIYVFQQYEEMTGINIEWINVPSGVRSERINLAMNDVGNMPDIFLKMNISSVNQLQYGDDGAILDLSQANLLETYAPNFYSFMEDNPNVKQSQTSPNGEIYSLPAAVDSPATKINRKIFINQTWLDNLGLAQPVTYEDWYNVLYAFKYDDPNGNGIQDEIPLTQSAGNLTSMFQGMWGLGNRGIHHTSFDIDETTGSVRHIKTADEYREVLEYIHKLYTDGLIDPEFLTYNDQKASALVSNDQLGVYLNTNLAMLPKEAEEHFVGIEAAPMGPNGDQVWSFMRSSLHSTGAFIISSECEYPEAALQWVDYFFSDEGMLFYHYGVEGETYIQTDDGYEFMPYILDRMDEGKSYDEAIADITPYGYGNNPTVMKAPYFAGAEEDPIPSQAAANLLPYTPDEVWPFFNYTIEENKIITDINSPINSYTTQKTAEFIMGQTPINDDTWKEYVDTVYAMGLEQVLEVYEAAYARIK